AAMELDQVHVVGLEPLQAPLDAREDRGRPPARSSPSVRVPALSVDIDVLASLGERAPDEALAVVIALGRVDDVQSCVERARDQPRDDTRADVLIADLGAAESEHTYHHVRPSESTSRQRARGSGACSHRRVSMTWSGVS